MVWEHQTILETYFPDHLVVLKQRFPDLFTAEAQSAQSFFLPLPSRSKNLRDSASLW
jgi:hypothetical protein